MEVLYPCFIVTAMRASRRSGRETRLAIPASFNSPCIGLSEMQCSAPYGTRKRNPLAALVAGSVSRATARDWPIGDVFADQLMYPKSPTLGILWKFWTLNLVQRVLERLRSKLSRQMADITTILDVSMFDGDGISCRLPDHVYAERSSRW